MIRFATVTILTSLSLVLFLRDANAVDPKKIAEKRNWAAYTFKDKDGKVCYIASAPSKQKGKYKKKNRGQPYALVTNRQSLKIKGEVNFIAGYNFKKDSSVKVTINKRTFDLFTEEDGAWSSKPSLDAKLVKAMKDGSRMVVVGISSRGTKTTDTYSLSGFTAMKKRIDMACR